MFRRVGKKREGNSWRNNIYATNIFLGVFFLIFFLIIVVNIALIAYNLQKLRYVNSTDPKVFTRNFQKYILVNEGKIYLSEEGQDELNNNGGWVQIISNELEEIYSFNKPQEIPTEYTTFQLIHGHEYDVNKNTIFISEKDLNNKKYIYIIGFKIDYVAKYRIMFSPEHIKESIKKMSWFILGDIVIILIMAYLILFKKLAMPINNLIKVIDNLAEGKYDSVIQYKGVYKNVFENLDILRGVLKKNLNKTKKEEKLRRQWIFSISHDIKTPLSSIKGFSEILRDENYQFTNDEVRKYSNIIWAKSMYIQELIDELSLSDKLQNKRVPLRLKSKNMIDFLEEIIHGIKEEPTYCEYNILLKFHKKNIYANIDEILMKRALINLIINALKYNNSFVNVWVEVTQQDNCVQISITDDGVGIEEEELKYIFNRYYRGTNTTNVEGSGLGMAIAKDIIQGHNGSVEIKSIKNKGTTVKVKL